VRPDQIEIVLAALDSVYQQIGLAGYTEAAHTVQLALAKTDQPEKATKAKIAMAVGELLFQQHAGTGCLNVLRMLKGKKFFTHDELRKALAKEPDLTNDDLVLIDKLKNIPKQARASLEKVMKQIRPKGGHPWVVPPSDYGTICNEIAAKHRTGLSLAEAKRQVADAHRCSLRTINSIYKKRGESK
jgi:hypothetical protein